MLSLSAKGQSRGYCLAFTLDNSPLSICLRGLVMKSLEPNLKHRNEACGNKFKYNTREMRNENKYSVARAFPRRIFVLILGQFTL